MHSGDSGKPDLNQEGAGVGAMKSGRQPEPVITEEEGAMNPIFSEQKDLPGGIGCVAPPVLGQLGGGNEQEGKRKRSGRSRECGSGVWEGGRGSEAREKQSKTYNRQTTLFLYH